MKTNTNRYLRAFLLVTMFFAVYMLFEPYWLENKVYIVKSKDIPQTFDQTKIVFLSDIHQGPHFSQDRTRRLVRRVNRLHPDLIVLGGDYVQENRRYVRPCFDELRNLHANLGIYGVLGNHDHRESAKLIRRSMRENGFMDLDNRAFWIYKDRERIKICGVGDYFTDFQSIEPTVGDVTVHDFVVLVSHNPDYIETLHTKKVDLMLSGHTHGGQVTVFGLWAPRIPSRYGQKFRTGVIRMNHIELLVSNGVGTEGLPIRFFARPQLVTVILKRIE